MSKQGHLIALRIQSKYANDIQQTVYRPEGLFLCHLSDKEVGTDVEECWMTVDSAKELYDQLKTHFEAKT